MVKSFAVLAVTAALVSPAAAQTTWYVVQDTATKRCTVVSEKPATTTTVVVGDSGRVYTTREEAENAMRTIKVCETN